MNVIEFFNREGVRFPVDGSRPQVLDDPNYVWMVDGEKVSVFLTTIEEENLTGARGYLFDAVQGDLIFGIAPEGFTNRKTLLVSGLMGSGLIRMDISRLRLPQEEEAAEEIRYKVTNWLNTLSKLIKRGDDPTSEIALTREKEPDGLEYIKNPLLLAEYHRLALKYMSNFLENKSMAEQKRLQEKYKFNKRILSNSISEIASINNKEKDADLKELSGNFLLDACMLIGQSMDIKIISPPVDDQGDQSGISLEDIARASRIRTRGVALGEEWYKQDGGSILGYMEEDNRPVALIPVSPSKYILHDVAFDTKKYVNKETAEKVKYFGVVFYKPFENKKITVWDILSHGIKSCWKRDLARIAAMGMLGGILGTAIPLATGIVFSSIIPEGERGQLLQIALFLVASALSGMLFQFIRSLAALRLEGKMEGSIQASVWDRLLSLPVPFFKQFSAGELAMRAMGISQIRTILSGVTMNTVLSSIFSIFTFALLFYYDSRLAGTAAILVVIAILVMGFLGYYQIRYENKVLEISNNISGILLQLIGGVTKFRVAGAESRAFHRWSREFSKQRKLTYKKGTIANWLTTFNSFFPVFSSIIIFYRLTFLKSRMEPGQFIAFNSAFISFITSMVSLSQSLINANVVIPLYQRARPILETLPEYDDNKITPKPLKGSIEVSHISFRYREDGPLILKDISFQINEGDYVAIVGASGCGKSTLFRILLGFEKPETGEVYYDGQDLAKIDIRAVRRQLGVVLQNGQLMIGNIFSNIVGGNPHLTIDDAWKAAKMAGIDEDIRQMPMGMHTIISQGAGTISGGQKQRLMIARAIVKEPRIIFFDEATSALDNNTQDIVSKSLDQLKATRLVIAHRLSTIINCNRILVMDKGRIVETGTYEELMKSNGIFAELAKRQLA